MHAAIHCMSHRESVTPFRRVARARDVPHGTGRSLLRHVRDTSFVPCRLERSIIRRMKARCCAPQARPPVTRDVRTSNVVWGRASGSSPDALDLPCRKGKLPFMESGLVDAVMDDETKGGKRGQVRVNTRAGLHPSTRPDRTRASETFPPTRTSRRRHWLHSRGGS